MRYIPGGRDLSFSIACVMVSVDSLLVKMTANGRPHAGVNVTNRKSRKLNSSRLPQNPRKTLHQHGLSK